MIQPLNTPADSEYVISTGSKDAYVVAMVMQGNKFVKAYTGKEGTVTMPVGIHDLLVMVVNKSKLLWLYSLEVSASRRTGLTPATAELLEKTSGEFTASITSNDPGNTFVVNTTGKLTLSANKNSGIVNVSIPSLGYAFSGDYDASSGLLVCSADKAAKMPAATLLFNYTEIEGASDQSNPFAVISEGGVINILVYDSSGKIIAVITSSFAPFSIN